MPKVLHTRKTPPHVIIYMFYRLASDKNKTKTERPILLPVMNQNPPSTCTSILQGQLMRSPNATHTSTERRCTTTSTVSEDRKPPQDEKKKRKKSQKRRRAGNSKTRLLQTARGRDFLWPMKREKARTQFLITAMIYASAPPATLSFQ